MMIVDSTTARSDVNHTADAMYVTPEHENQED
jgi:hypothetical protein